MFDTVAYVIENTHLAKENARLRAENETHKEIAVRETMNVATLRAALKPFADKADHYTQGAYWMDAVFTVDECRAAAAALKETSDD